MDRESEQEADALAAWEGRGAVRLLASDRRLGALLLERLDATRDLRTVAPRDAMIVAGKLLRRLAIPAPPWARRLDEEVTALRIEVPERWEATGRPFSRGLLERTLETIRALAPATGGLLVDIDLHHENVLAGRREPWLVIDPKVIGGELEYGVAQLLWQPHSGIDSRQDLDVLLGILSDAARLDVDRARKWSLVRIVDYWLWAVELDLADDPARCARLVSWL